MACQSGLQPRTPLRHYVALFPSRGRKTLRKYPWCHQCCMTESQSLLPLEEGVAVRRRMIAAFQRKAEVLKGPDVTHSVYHELSVFLRAPPSSIPVGQLKGRCLYLSRFPLRGTPRSGKGCTRLRMTMLLHCCSTQGQLWSTRAFYAECAQYLAPRSQSIVNTSRREGCRLAVRAAESVNPACSVVHPCATTWPSSPKGDASGLHA